MKTIGLIGGTSYASTLDYYQILNEQINQKLGKLHSAKILLHSLDYQTAVYEHKQNNDWQSIADYFTKAAQDLQNIGANMILICANMPHKIAPQISKNIKIPLVHIGAATGEHIAKQGYHTVGLIGSREIMEQDYLKKYYYPECFGKVLIPDENDRQTINNIIFNEMCKGEFKEQSRQSYLKIIEKLHHQGAQAIIMGCTEIPILLKNTQTPIPLLNTTHLHCQKATNLALSDHTPK